MIYTVTFNPAVDYYITVADLKTGLVNRTQSESVCFGGKGINVSLVLKELGISSTALGFIGGFTGAAIEAFLTQKRINCDFVMVDGNTRINVKLNDTDINASGPDISQENLDLFYQKLDSIKKDDFLVLSGSVPNSLPQNTYETILEYLKHKGIKFVIDAEKDLLLNTLKFNPFLIKPNHYELGQIFGVSINSFEQALLYAEKLHIMGAKNVMVSMGEIGAIMIDENGNKYTQKSPSGTLVSAVGSGDSALAAFIAKYLNGGDCKSCLQYAVAAGSATAFSNGLASRNLIEDIYNSYS